jgi:hypothetical protein
MIQWNWVSAACRGTSHERSDVRLQDSHSCFIPKGKRNDVFVAIVSDGAGSASFGGQGASLLCRTIGKEIRNHFMVSADLPTDEQIETWIDTARDLIFNVAQRRGLVPRDFAATLVFAISDGINVIIGHVGDGCIVIKDDELNKWLAPSWPDHGEYASTTTFVTDEPAPKLSLVRHKGAVSALVLFTDGLERLALDFLSKQPHEKFFEGICRPLFSNTIIGFNRALTEELKRYLNSDPINARTDDDKTLVIAVLK